MSCKMGIARAAGIGALAACGLLMTQARIAEAQQGRITNAGDTTRDTPPGTPTAPANGGMSQDSRMLLTHALEMAIEGSALQALAMQPGMTTGSLPGAATPGALRPGSGVDAPSGTVPTVGSRAGVPGTASTAPGTGAGASAADRAGTAGTAAGTGLTAPVAGADVASPVVGTGLPNNASTPSVASPASGFTGAPGETVSGRPVAAGTGAIVPVPATAGAAARGAAIAGAPGAAIAGAPGASTMNIRDATMLQQHAEQAFQAGERMLVQAGRDSGPDQGLLLAANRYISTLRSLSMRTPERDAAGGLSGADMVSIALINHAVKEAIGSLKIRQLSRTMGSADSPSAQMLLTHAREMDTQSRTIIQGFPAAVTPARVPGTRVNADEVLATSGIVPALAQQASEIIAALQGFGADVPATTR